MIKKICPYHRNSHTEQVCPEEREVLDEDDVPEGRVQTEPPPLQNEPEHETDDYRRQRGKEVT